MLGLRTKILLGFGGLLAILLLVSSVSSYVFTRYSGATQVMLRQDYDSVSACRDMEEAVESTQTLLDRFLLGKPADSASVAAALAKEAETFDQALSLQRNSLNLPGESQATDAVADLWTQYHGALSPMIDAATPPIARGDIFERAAQPLAKQLIEATHRITELNRENLTSTQGEAQTLSHNALYALHVLTATAVVIAAAFALAIGRVILGPLGSLTRSVREIHQGNLDASVPVRTRDELGQLAAAFNEMAQQLRVFRRIDHEKLMRTQRTTQLAIDSLPDPVIVLNPEGRIELTNQAGNHWFGLAPGMSIDSHTMPWLRDAVARASDEAAPPPEAAGGYESAIHVRRGGDDRHLLPQAVPIRDENGRVIGATVVLNDVTGLRRLDQMKSGLLSLVSHELKTPLTSMRMILHLVVQERIAPLDRQVRDLLVTARDESDRLHQTVENLLDMGRIESGKVLMELRPIAVRELLDRTLEPLRAAVKEHGLQLQIDLGEEELPQVRADVTRIGHVMANLIGNALRYTGSGGTLTVSARARNDHGTIEIAVSDTGSGIPPEFLPRVFEKFFRVPDQPAGGGGGAGLGLAIVRDIIEAHGGRVTVESQPDHGTTFRFTLQSVPSHTPHGPSPPPRRLPGPPPPAIEKRPAPTG